MINNSVPFNFNSDFLTGIIYITQALTSDALLSDVIKTFKKFSKKNCSYVYILSFCNKFKNIVIKEDLVLKIKSFCSLYDKYSLLDEEQIEEELLENLILTKKDYLLIALLEDLLIKDEKFPFKTSFKILFNGLEDFSFNFDISNIYNSILLIPDSKKDFEINTILSNDIEKLIADGFNLKCIKDIENKLSIEVYLTFCNHIIELDEFLVKSSLDYEFDCHELTYASNSLYDIFEKIDIFDYQDKLMFKIDERDLDVLFFRSKIFGIHSLESIGQKFNLTRERVRQIEKKAIYKIACNIQKIKGKISLFVASFFEDVFLPQRIFFDNLKTHQELKIIFSTIFEQGLLDEFRYDDDYDVIYINELLKEKIDNTLNNLPSFISAVDYSKYPYFEAKVISLNYKLNNDKLFVRKGLYQSDIYSYIIEEVFPNGFSASEHNVELFNKYIDEHFSGMEHCNGHTILSSMERTGYILINRGTYLHISKVNRINPILKDEIINYILSFNGTIYYATLFEKYKDRLIKDGIENKYYFKGVLDIELPSDIVTKRDYLCSSEEFVSSKEMLSQEINKLEIVTLEHLRGMFPGVQDSVLSTAIFNEKLIALDYGMKFMAFKKMNLTDDFIPTLKLEMENLFSISKTSFITSHKLYARMRILHKELMNKNKIITGHFTLFSILQYILEGKYYFRRPYISLENVILEKDALVDNYVNSLERFSVQSINSFLSKTGLTVIYSFLEFFIDKSDDFVQVSIDTAVRKQLLGLDEIGLYKIKKELDFYINSFGDIDTRKFNAYSFLPNLKYQWNKYLLAGIVRTYFNEYYDIEYTNTMYNLTDFIIRRY